MQPGSLAKADELVVDEAILDVVELVNVLHNCLTLGLVEIEGEASVLPAFGTRVDDIVVFADSIAGVDAPFEDSGAGAELRFAPQPPAARPAGGREGVECLVLWG